MKTQDLKTLNYETKKRFEIPALLKTIDEIKVLQKAVDTLMLHQYISDTEYGRICKDLDRREDICCNKLDDYGIDWS